MSGNRFHAFDLDELRLLRRGFPHQSVRTPPELLLRVELDEAIAEAEEEAREDTDELMGENAT